MKARSLHTRTAAALLLPLLTLLGHGCGHPEEPGAPPARDLPADARTFTVRGVVRDRPADGRSLLIRHEAIPGYMPGMTMEFTLLDTNNPAPVRIGDTIEFRLVARTGDHFIDRIRVLESASTSAPPPAPAPADVPPRRIALRTGDPAPDVPLLSETGRILRLSSLQGRAVAFTFFFTRCPLPDFCPRMNRNLLEARALLQAAPAGPTNWTLLSISFDAAFDQPAVLAAHARSYRGTNTSGWEFAAADTNALARLRPAFDLKVAREDGGFSHNLRTVVLDPLGRVFRQFDGNRWTAGELAQAITEAAKTARAQ